MQPKLSILIPSLFKRIDMLAGLLKVLQNQIVECNAKEDVEILTEIDNGQFTVGEKRNILLQKAKGDYVISADDDDFVSPDYIKLILEGIATNPDCCSLNGIITFNGKAGKLFRHSIKYDRYYEEDGIYYRYPNHISCIKASIAKKFHFPAISHGEDTSFATQIHNSGLLKKEYNIPTIIYFYNFITDKK